MAITTAAATSFKQQALSGQHVLRATSTFTANTTSGSPTLASVSSVVGLVPGMPITGTGIPASTVIAAIVSSSSVTMSANASATGTTVTITPTVPASPKLALFTSAASLDSSTTTYSSTNEATGTNYTASGYNLTIAASMPATSGTTAYLDFVDLVISSVTVTARGCMIYNPYAGLNRTISVHDFGSDKSAAAGDFTIVFPTPDATNAILRLT